VKFSDVQGVPVAKVRPFVKRWHYSGCVPTGRCECFEWLVDSECYAVAVYGPGVNTNMAAFLTKLTGCDVRRSALIELTRLCRSEPSKGDYPLTQFLGKCHRLLSEQGFEWVVSFSDPVHSHRGGIYRAANFSHVGRTVGEYHVVDAVGVVRHRRYAYRYARRNEMTVAEARTELGLTIKRQPPKDRWLLSIGHHHRSIVRGVSA
jgi:hypothetical protein